MSQPYDSGYSGGPQQPWGTPGQQSPSGYSGQQSGYPQQGTQPQHGGYSPQQNSYASGQAAPQQGYAPQHQQQQGYSSHQGYGTPPARHSASGGSKGSPAGIGIAIAGVLMAVGTFLPWISLKLKLGIGTGSSSSSGISQSLAGIKAGEGKVTIICAIAAIALGVLAMLKNGKIFGLVAIAPAALAALVVLKVFGDKAKYDSQFASLGSGSSVNISLGIGIYLCLIMAIAVVGLGVISAVTSRSR